MVQEELGNQRERMLDAWDAAAPGWGRQADRMQLFALPVSEWMVRRAALEPGQQVVELAAGPGDTGFMAARLVAPGGGLISSDAAAGMLAVARERAAEHGITNVEFKQLQLEWIDLPAASADAVLCRWGLMLVLDPAAALRECRRILKPGGRLALAVWDLPQSNPWATIISGVLVELGHAEPPPQGGPGMFALSHPGLLEELLATAGFSDIDTEPITIVRRYPNVSEWIADTYDHASQFAAVWKDLAGEQRDRLREHLLRAAIEYVDDAGAIELPGSTLAAVALA